MGGKQKEDSVSAFTRGDSNTQKSGYQETRRRFLYLAESGGVSVFILQLLQVPSQLHQLVWGFSCGLTSVLSLNGPSVLSSPTALHLRRATLLTLVLLAVTNYLMKAT